MTLRLARPVLALALLGLLGCAASLEIRGETPVTLAATEARAIRVTALTELQLKSVRQTVRIEPDTAFRAVGAIDRDIVFRPVDRVLLLRGMNRHEVYVVVRDRSAVALYIPGRGVSATLERPVLLTLAP